MPFKLFPHSETQGKREHMKSVEEAMMVVEAFLEMSTLYIHSTDDKGYTVADA